MPVRDLLAQPPPRRVPGLWLRRVSVLCVLSFPIAVVLFGTVGVLGTRFVLGKLATDGVEVDAEVTGFERAFWRQRPAYDAVVVYEVGRWQHRARIHNEGWAEGDRVALVVWAGFPWVVERPPVDGPSSGWGGVLFLAPFWLVAGAITVLVWRGWIALPSVLLARGSLVEARWTGLSKPWGRSGGRDQLAWGPPGGPRVAWSEGRSGRRDPAAGPTVQAVVLDGHRPRAMTLAGLESAWSTNRAGWIVGPALAAVIWVGSLAPFPSADRWSEADAESYLELARRGRAVEQAIAAYAADRGALPPNLDALVPAWLDAPPTDPWGRPFTYRARDGVAEWSSPGGDGAWQPNDWRQGAWRQADVSWRWSLPSD